MENTKSISQGSFLSIPESFNLSKLRRRKKRKANEEPECEGEWEKAFMKIWSALEGDMKKMSEQLYSKVLEELVKHVGKISKGDEKTADTIPCELLLTGTNLPDHTLLLSSLTNDLRSNVTPHVAALWASEASNLKTAVQVLVKQIVDCGLGQDDDSDDSDLDNLLDDRKKGPHLQISQLSLSTLTAWYNEKCSTERPPIVIVVPDFESFNPAVLGDFITLLCGYTDRIPFILILGVATSPSAMYQGLSRAVLSRLVVQLFHTEPSPTFLNHVIETMFLSEKCPFRLGSRTMTFLTDVFLFHSFSVQRFVQGFKYCMMEHVFRKDHMTLCCTDSELEGVAARLTPESVENLRKLPSFQKHVEGCQLPRRRELLLDDKLTKKFAVESLRRLQEHTSDFHVVIKCLNILSRDFPSHPLGRHVREVYCRAVSSDIRQDKDFKQVMTLLSLQSWGELLPKVDAVLNLLKIDNILDILSEEQNRFETAIGKLENLKKDMERMAKDPAAAATNGDVGRKDIRQDLANTIDSDLLQPFLEPPMSFVLHEIFYFDDLVSIRRRISGAPRSAIHKALNNPHHYLECDCCVLSHPDAVTTSLPDLSIVYKLYLESSKLISLSDWMQSFASVVRPEDSKEVDEELQARFSRAVSELQFLGYIKPSKTKADQVMRLTFGNS